MFLVTKIDAFIENIPGYCFALAIGTTVTTEERDVIMSSVVHISTQLRIQKAVLKYAGHRVALIRTRFPPFNPQQNPQSIAATSITVMIDLIEICMV